MMAGEKIWIAEDDHEDQQVYMEIFEEADILTDTRFFDSGKDIVEELKKSPALPRLLILDNYMPVMNGAEVVQSLVQSGLIENFKVVLIGGGPHLKIPSELLQKYGITVFKKPNTFNEFNQLVNSIVSKLD